MCLRGGRLHETVLADPSQIPPIEVCHLHLNLFDIELELCKFVHYRTTWVGKDAIEDYMPVKSGCAPATQD